MKKVIPFSNGSESLFWVESNCEICKTSKGCTAKKNIELGFITGEITIKSSEFIGSSAKCNFFNKRKIGHQNRTKKVNINQFNLEL